ncbi:MAG: ornithine decarboxylase, partial [Lachnospiraceae bacterium]|nr:ornithine decarboxylase [Lachnospiraceae bacterium]
ELEMVSGDYCLAMTSVSDRKEGLDRLADALSEIDEIYNASKKPVKAEVGFIERVYKPLRRVCALYEAFDLPRKIVSFDDAVGKTSGLFIYLYPPDIPLIVPGEEISDEFVENLRECRRKKLALKGLPDEDGELISIADF